MRMVFFSILLGSLMVQAQDKQIKRVPITPTLASSGQQMFNAYCAACHGVDGRGDGPAATALKTRPADLSQLTRNNGGKYPEGRLAAILRAPVLPVHVSHEMPVWGELLSSVSSNEGELQLRTANLVKYIYTLQDK